MNGLCDTKYSGVLYVFRTLVLYNRRMNQFDQTVPSLPKRKNLPVWSIVAITLGGIIGLAACIVVVMAVLIDNDKPVLESVRQSIQTPAGYTVIKESYSNAHCFDKCPTLRVAYRPPTGTMSGSLDYSVFTDQLVVNGFRRSEHETNHSYTKEVDNRTITASIGAHGGALKSVDWDKLKEPFAIAEVYISYVLN